MKNNTSNSLNRCFHQVQRKIPLFTVLVDFHNILIIGSDRNMFLIQNLNSKYCLCILIQPQPSRNNYVSSKNICIIGIFTNYVSFKMSLIFFYFIKIDFIVLLISFHILPAFKSVTQQYKNIFSGYSYKKCAKYQTGQTKMLQEFLRNRPRCTSNILIFGKLKHISGSFRRSKSQNLLIIFKARNHATLHLNLMKKKSF